MTTKPTELNKNIVILGFSDVKLDDINAFLKQFRTQNNGAPIQLFDARYVAGKQHLYFAAINALDAFKKKTNISNNLEVEALLYASGQRQITKAVEMMGIKQDTTQLAALIMAEDNNKKSEYVQLVTKIIPGKHSDNVLDLNDKKFECIKNLFEISELEFEASLKKEVTEKETLTDLVIERMALLVTKS